MYETSCQSRFDARYWMLGASALGWPRGMVWGGRREDGSGWGTHVYLWQIHFDIWQNQNNIVKLNKIKLKKNKESGIFLLCYSFYWDDPLNLCFWNFYHGFIREQLWNPERIALLILSQFLPHTFGFWPHCRFIIPYLILKSKVKVLVAQQCPTLWDPMDCSLLGYSVHRILQSRILEWVAIPSPGNLSNPEIEPMSALAGRFFSATWEAPGMQSSLKNDTLKEKRN